MSIWAPLQKQRKELIGMPHGSNYGDVNKTVTKCRSKKQVFVPSFSFGLMPYIAYQVSLRHAWKSKPLHSSFMFYYCIIEQMINLAWSKNAPFTAVANSFHNISVVQLQMSLSAPSVNILNLTWRCDNGKLLFFFFKICAPESHLWHSVKIIC